jgi:hypothetical protein
MLAVPIMTTLRDIVADYISCCREDAEQEQRWFAIQRTLEEAVSRAALAVSPSGKRLSHQRRIPQGVLAESRRRLVASLPALAKAKSFEELHETVAATIGPIQGIGGLTIVSVPSWSLSRMSCSSTRALVLAQGVWA